MVSGPSSWALFGTLPRKQLEGCGVKEAKSDPSGKVFISEQSIIWERKALKKSPLLSTVEANLRQSSLKKADSSNTTTCLRETEIGRQTWKWGWHWPPLAPTYAVHRAGHFTRVIFLSPHYQWGELGHYNAEFPPSWRSEEMSGDQTSPVPGRLRFIIQVYSESASKRSALKLHTPLMEHWVWHLCVN